MATVGRHIENKLAERDEKGRPKTSIEVLLGLPPVNVHQASNAMLGQQ